MGCRSGLIRICLMKNSSIGPLPDLMPRTQPYQQPPLVNASLINSSSLVSFQIEPPSNQSYYSTYASLWQQQEKTYLFFAFPVIDFVYDQRLPKGRTSVLLVIPIVLLKILLSLSSACCPPITHPVSGSDESSSCGNGSTFNLDNVVPFFREVPPCPRGITEPSSKKICRENGISSGEFLTLAPPVLTSPYLSPRCKPSSAHISFRNREFHNSDPFPYQGAAENPVADSVRDGLNHQPFL
ncbi:hypothetical protein Ancab_025537 [Ancistrocladus abbreviatus]